MTDDKNQEFEDEGYITIAIDSNGINVTNIGKFMQETNGM